MKTFKQFVAEKFDDAEHGKPISFTGYHNTMKPKFKHDTSRNLFVSDEETSWASPWIKRSKVHKLKVRLKNPAVFKKSKRNFEGDILRQANDLKKAGHDGIIYTPAKGVKTMRQALIFGK